ncbi:DNA-binding protein [Lojkania enalia]|uniref:DNA-binding protein n=1 Tax=Lojkania enalia TaxID=147567 RepID=A0A9P4K8T7_9PLEO|nr:DNA-binding protein [Didymosphaeria enalia]
MARKQAMKTRAAVQAAVDQGTATSTIIATEQATTTKQSTEVVQTLVHGSISALAYIRNIFPDSCFEHQIYETINNDYTYDDYAKDNGQPVMSKRRGTRMQVLKRGRSARVDRLLDWLEIGAFDALQKGYLRGLQISIFEDRDKPSNVVELYSFTFHYAVSAGSRVVSEVEMEGPLGDRITVKKAKYAMQILIRKVVAVCNTMPDLPAHRFLKMHLIYTEDCPDDYLPPGFELSTDYSIRYPNSGWKKMDSNMGKVDAGFHSVSLNVSHLYPNTEEDVNIKDVAVPNGLTYGEPESRFDHIDVENKALPVQFIPSEDMKTHQLEQQKVVKRSTADSKSSMDLDGQDADLDIVSRLSLLATQETSQDESTPTPMTVHQSEPIASGGSTASSAKLEDIRIQRRLHQMLQPSVHQDDTQSTQPQANPQQSFLDPIDISTQSELKLSQTVIRQLEKSRSSLLPPRKAIGSLRRTSIPAGLGESVDKVLCQCGYNEEEGDMINCGFCETWQHVHCYGYRGLDDQRLPKDHACYQCLLQGKHDALFRELRGLVLLRRAIYILEARGYSNDKQLAQILQCDLQTVSKVATELRGKGFLVPAQGRTKKSLAGNPRFSVSKAEGVVSRIMKEYYDPTTKIAHYFQFQPSSSISVQPAPMEESTSRFVGAPAVTIDETQYRRYTLRNRNNQIAQGEDVAQSSTKDTSTSPVGQRKRTRLSDEALIASTPKRLMRMDTSMDTLDIVEFATPASAH